MSRAIRKLTLAEFLQMPISCDRTELVAPRCPLFSIAAIKAKANPSFITVSKLKTN